MEGSRNTCETPGRPSEHFRGIRGKPRRPRGPRRIKTNSLEFKGLRPMPLTQTGGCRAAKLEQTWTSQANVRAKLQAAKLQAARLQAAGCALQGCRQQVANCKAARLQAAGCKPQSCKAKTPYLAVSCYQHRSLHFLRSCLREEAKTLYYCNWAPQNRYNSHAPTVATQHSGGEAPHLLEGFPGPRGQLRPQKQRFIKPCPTWGGICFKLPMLS